MKEAAGSSGQNRMKIFLETAKLTGEQLNISEKQVLDTTLCIYEEWKKEFAK